MTCIANTEFDCYVINSDWNCIYLGKPFIKQMTLELKKHYCSQPITISTIDLSYAKSQSFANVQIKIYKFKV